MTLTCLCGSVRIETDQSPAFAHRCNCDLCRKSGATWAYFHPDAVRVEGATRGFVRTDKAEPSARLHSCETCAATSHFRLTQEAAARHGDTMMGVNLMLAEESDLAGIELRFPDGRGWDGAGEFGYVREPQTLG